jgi:hypothetical protein
VLEYKINMGDYFGNDVWVFELFKQQDSSYKEYLFSNGSEIIKNIHACANVGSIIGDEPFLDSLEGSEEDKASFIRTLQEAIDRFPPEETRRPFMRTYVNNYAEEGDSEYDHQYIYTTPLDNPRLIGKIVRCWPVNEKYLAELGLEVLLDRLKTASGQSP